MYKKSLLYVGSTVGSKNMSNNQYYSLGWNLLILHHIYTVISVLKRWHYNPLQLKQNTYPTLYPTRKALFYHHIPSFKILLINHSFYLLLFTDHLSNSKVHCNFRPSKYSICLLISRNVQAKHKIHSPLQAVESY